MIRAPGRATSRSDTLLFLTCLGLSAGALRITEHFDTGRGLVHPRVFFLGEDANGALWIGDGNVVQSLLLDTDDDACRRRMLLSRVRLTLCNSRELAFDALC